MQSTVVPQNLFLIFTIAVVVSVVIQCCVFLGMLIVVMKAVKKFTGIAEELKAKALPIMGQGQTIITDLTPKIKTISANLVETSNTVREQVKHVDATVGDVVDKSKQQAERVDDMVSAVLDGVTHAGETIKHGVKIPVRQIAGILNGIAAAIESFKRSPKARPVSDSQDFV
jgi:methyl-accepting chemotaxis protein